MPDLSRQEIESHSSQLTNLRISNLARMLCVAEMEANNAIPPTIQHAIAYHSALLTFYFETSEAYDTNINKDYRIEIEKCVKLGESLAIVLKTNPKVQQLTTELMIQNCKAWRHLMHKGMQNLKYWFRMGKHDPRGIGEILKLFDQQKPAQEGEGDEKL